MTIKTLVLTLGYATRTSYYDDWSDAFANAPGLDVTARNIRLACHRRQIQRTIADYELIVVLHSCTADSLMFVEPLVSALQARRGRLVCFVGNEFNLPWAPLGSKIAWLQSVAPDIIATQLLEEAGCWLYEAVGTRVIGLPHALNPNVYKPRTPFLRRKIDIGTRSFFYTAYVGDDDRNRMIAYFATRDFGPGFTLDLRTEKRLSRLRWASFLDGCKATIATEAGSWYLERDDETVMAIRAYVSAKTYGLTLRADSGLRRLAHALPYAVKTAVRPLLRRGPILHEALSAERLEFSEIHERFFLRRQRAPVYSKCISSRHFDAVGTKTLQIMFPGRFNDVLRPHEHYVPLEPDFSNIDDVQDVLRDSDACTAIVNRAREHVMENHTYQHRIDSLTKALGQ